MRLGIPKESKILEGRVVLVPAAVRQLVDAGCTVLVEQDAGLKSGYSDSDYWHAGARISEREDIYSAGTDIILKVKEPYLDEISLLKPNHVLFSYLHLAAEPELTKHLQEIGLTAIAFETVQDNLGRLPLLAPMSDVAGRVAVQQGTTLLHHINGGKGLLLGGLPTADRGHVVILGAGVAGMNAARLAAGMGARVTVFDINRDRLEAARDIGSNVNGLFSYPDAIAEAVKTADLLIGATLIVGEKAKHLVTTEMVKSMQPGSVIVDISVDQGGCVETTRPTTHAEPTYVEHGVVHYAVTNMPGAVPRSSTQAISAAVIPYVFDLFKEIPVMKLYSRQTFHGGINVQDGRLIHQALINQYAKS